MISDAAAQCDGLRQSAINGGLALDMFDRASRYSPAVLSILRIMTALLLLQYPLSKFFGFPTVMNPPMFSLPWIAGVIELIGGTLVLIGLFTRPAAFVLSGLMAFAYFLGHVPRGFYPIGNGGVAPILFCFVFLYLAVAGAGPWSVDAKRGGRF